MQFPYECEHQCEIIERLQRIENILVNFHAQNDLVKELVNKKVYQQNGSSVPIEQKSLKFILTTVLNEENNPTCIRVAGRTYDIRDRIKQFGQATWKSDIKSWEMKYSADIYSDLKLYLQTLTTDVQEETVVVVV